MNLPSWLPSSLSGKPESSAMRLRPFRSCAVGFAVGFTVTNCGELFENTGERMKTVASAGVSPEFQILKPLR
jgi:hypothetical protein